MLVIDLSLWCTKAEDLFYKHTSKVTRQSWLMNTGSEILPRMGWAVDDDIIRTSPPIEKTSSKTVNFRRSWLPRLLHGTARTLLYPVVPTNTGTFTTDLLPLIIVGTGDVRQVGMRQEMWDSSDRWRWQDAWDRRHEIGDMRQEIGDVRQETKDKRHKTG